ncbi:MAG: CBS domain-containing protein, partial [Pontibacterium sp.]
MSHSLNLENMPFCLLDKREQDLLLSNLDISYFQKGEVVIEAGANPGGVFIILKGRVSENEAADENDPHSVESVFVEYTNEDYFGAWSSIRGKAIHNFTAVEETICHVLPTRTLLDLMDSNGLFADYFQQNLAAKTEIVAQHGPEQDMAEFMLAKVSGGVVREPLIILEGTPIEDAVRLMREQKADCMLVRRGTRYGIVTGTDLLDAVVVNRVDLNSDIAEIATYRLLTIDQDDYLFNALVLMTQQHIERIVVTKNGGLEGIIELTDVLSYF